MRVLGQCLHGERRSVGVVFCLALLGRRFGRARLSQNLHLEDLDVVFLDYLGHCGLAVASVVIMPEQ